MCRDLLITTVIHADDWQPLSNFPSFWLNIEIITKALGHFSFFSNVLGVPFQSCYSTKFQKQLRSCGYIRNSSMWMQQTLLFSLQQLFPSRWRSRKKEGKSFLLQGQGEPERSNKSVYTLCLMQSHEWQSMASHDAVHVKEKQTGSLHDFIL